MAEKKFILNADDFHPGESQYGVLLIDEMKMRMNGPSCFTDTLVSYQLDIQEIIT